MPRDLDTDLDTTETEEETEPTEVLKYDEEADNFVPIFAETEDGKIALTELSDRVLTDFDEAWRSGERARKQRKIEWDLFTNVLPERDKKFKDMANVSLTIVLENISRLVHRAESELFGDWTNVFGVMPVGPDDVEQADILSKHGNWQLTQKILDFPRQQQRGLLHFYLFGDVVAHSYYDEKTKRNRHEILTMDDFVVPFTAVSTMPDFSDVQYRVRIIRKYRHSMEAKRGIWYGVDQVIDGEKPDWSDDPQPELALRNADKLGYNVDELMTAPYIILQYEGWYLLPKMDRERFIQAFVDYKTGAVLDVHIHEEAPWEETIRYETQLRELEQYKDTYQQHQYITSQMEYQRAQIGQQVDQGLLDAGDMNQAEPVGPEEQPPPAPEWMKNPFDMEEMPPPKKTSPIHMFSHGVCIESLTGVSGIGYGRIVTAYNIAANILLCQYIDSASLANCNTLITTDLVRWKNPFRIGPGVVNTVGGIFGSDLKNNIMPMTPGQANPQMKDLVEMFVAMGQSSIQSPDVLSGEPGKSGETFRGIATRVEQATKQLSVTTRSYARFVQQILKNNARLNAIYMDDIEIFMVNDDKVGMTTETISKKLYERDYSTIIRSDLKYTSQTQKAENSSAVLEIAQNNPYLVYNAAFMYKALRDYLEALGKSELIAMLGPEPPPPQQPMMLPQQQAATPEGGQGGQQQGGQ